MSTRKNQLLTVAEAAERLGVAAPTVYAYIRDGRLVAAERAGWGLRIPASALRGVKKGRRGRPAGSKNRQKFSKKLAETP